MKMIKRIWGKNCNVFIFCLVLSLLFGSLFGCSVGENIPEFEEPQTEVSTVGHQVLKYGNDDDSDEDLTGDVGIDASNRQVVNIKAYQFAYDPVEIHVKEGEVLLTVTSLDVAHGFAILEMGVNERIPPEESKTFVLDFEKGEYEYFNTVYSGKGWKEMRGRIIVE